MLNNRNQFPIIASIMGLSLCSAIALVVGGQNPLGTTPRVELFYIMVSFTFGVAALGVLSVSRGFDISWSKVLWFAFLVRLITIQAWPLLEDDFFRYLWDGRQTVETLSPWQFAPEAYFTDQSLSQKWQWVLNNINYPELPSIYGPVLQYLFALAYLVSPADLTVLQLLLLLVDMGILVSLAYFGVHSRWLMAYAIHPIVLKEAMASAHPDSIVALALIWALIGWKKNNAVIVGLALAFAIATKVSALIVLPFLLINRVGTSNLSISFDWVAKTTLTCILALVVLYVPLLQGAGSEWSSLLVFAQDWRFNPLLYRILEFLFLEYSRGVAAFCMVLSILCLIAYWKKQDISGEKNLPPLDLALLVLLLFSPVVNSWYWLWLLPLAVINNRPCLFVCASVSVFAYCNSSVIPEMYPDDFPEFYVSYWITFLELAVFLIVIYSGFVAKLKRVMD